MSTNKTKNYQFHAWELGDDFLLAEMNENFAALDRILGEQWALGQYMGDGTAERDISLGFQPRMVFVMGTNGMMNTLYHSFGGLALPGYSTIGVTVTEDGFRVAYTGNSSSSFLTPQTNLNNVRFHYIALR